ncbi:hypothetical protein ACGFYV_20765 [Streptomyces sp. NPDC048297]|uniref:hypothetical protein n=1 Tax=Streptomyces sp. NPDC048297 TaxID=3365531 RepID=UPI003714516A
MRTATSGLGPHSVRSLGGPPGEKISALHTVAQHEEGAATVTGDLLTRDGHVAGTRV